MIALVMPVSSSMERKMKPQAVPLNHTRDSIISGA